MKTLLPQYSYLQCVTKLSNTIRPEQILYDRIKYLMVTGCTDTQTTERIMDLSFQNELAILR